MFHELFDGQQNLPYHIFLIDAETYNNHFHPEMEICFILYGNAEFHVEQQVYPLYEHDFLIMNPLELHRVNSCSKHCHLLLLHINLTAFQPYAPELALTRFSFSNAVNNRSMELYQRLYQGFRSILNIGISQSAAWKLSILREVSDILEALIHYETSVSASAERTALSSLKEENQKRILSILDYLDRHWQDSISVEQLARQMRMSPSYFSRFFKNAMGIGILKYLTNLRLNRSLHPLLNTEMPITDIAMECGFNDYKTYGRLFRSEFGTSPSDYRKNRSARTAVKTEDIPVSSVHILNSMSPIISNSSSKKELCTIELDAEKLPSQSLRLNCYQTVNIGTAAGLLRHNIQEQLLYAKKHFPIHYVRFSGIFSEEMLVYNKDSGDTDEYNWDTLDEILDFLTLHHLHPFIVLDGLPTDAEKRRKLLLAFAKHSLQHCRDTRLMAQCRIQLGVLPELPLHDMHGKENTFLILLKQTFQILRNAMPHVSLGAPSVIGWKNFEMFQRFLQYCKKEKLDFNFYCLNSCNFTNAMNHSLPALLKSCAADYPYLDGEKQFAWKARRMKSLLQENNADAPIILTEWALNPYCRAAN